MTSRAYACKQVQPHGLPKEFNNLICNVIYKMQFMQYAQGTYVQVFSLTRHQPKTTKKGSLSLETLCMNMCS